MCGKTWFCTRKQTESRSQTLGSSLEHVRGLRVTELEHGRDNCRTFAVTRTGGSDSTNCPKGRGPQSGDTIATRENAVADYPGDHLTDQQAVN